MSESTTALLDAQLPIRTAGALPSSRTEDMLKDALESDDIDAVKSQLAHVWSHYQSLEFALNRLPSLVELFKETAIGDGLADADPTEVALRAVALHILDSAYQSAHMVGLFISLGMTVPEGLRAIYADLDFSDPEREVNDEEIARFLTDTTGETTDGDSL